MEQSWITVLLSSSMVALEMLLDCINQNASLTAIASHCNKEAASPLLVAQSITLPLQFVKLVEGRLELDDVFCLSRILV